MSDGLCERLGIDHPIIQAPMAGGGGPPALVAAVSNAGGLGVLACAYSSPAQIADAVAEVRRLTDRPFGVNLFTGGLDDRRAVDPGPMLAILARRHAALGLPPPSVPKVSHEAPQAQLEAVLAARPPVFTFTFGLPEPAVLEAFRAQGTFLMGTATTVAEARAVAVAGADAVVAQGSEAGAHRGTFGGPFESAMVGTLALVPQVVDAVSVPVVAAGGIMDGRGIVAAQALGAAAVQMGTAFLTCTEAGIHEAYKAAIRAARDDSTVVTRAFSGRPARGIVNDFLREAEADPSAILPYPLQNAVTRPLRNAAGARGDTRFLSLWAGQAAGLARDLPAGELVRRLVEETAAVRRRLV